jgi:hypothetical protein
VNFAIQNLSLGSSKLTQEHFTVGGKGQTVLEKKKLLTI